MVAPAFVTPDKFVVVSAIKDGARTKFVLSGFYGGYLNGDSWRLSRDVVEIEDQEDCWIMKTRTGSVYQLYKGRYGTTGMTAPILADMLEKSKDAPELAFQIEPEYK